MGALPADFPPGERETAEPRRKRAVLLGYHIASLPAHCQRWLLKLLRRKCSFNKRSTLAPFLQFHSSVCSRIFYISLNHPYSFLVCVLSWGHSFHILVSDWAAMIIQLDSTLNFRN